MVAGGEDADDLVAGRPAAAIGCRFLVRRPSAAADLDVLDPDAGQQLQPLFGRGNLHSSLGDDFQLDRRAAAALAACDKARTARRLVGGISYGKYIIDQPLARGAGAG